MAVKAAAQETVFDLTDAYSIMLTSESYTFNGNTSGVPAGKSCSTQVVSYLGGTPKKSNISKVTCPTGISVAIKENNTVAPTLTFTTTATIINDCEAIIRISVDDVTIDKKFSFGIAKTGATGSKGDKGNDGTSVTITAKSVTYQASTSGTTTPTGTWLANPPAVGKGQYLWTKTVVTYSDGNSTTAYSVAYQGTNGSNGQNGSPGRGVKSTEVTYQIWKDGTTTPTGAWSSTPPKTTADNPYLWTRTVITYTDDTKSTSYSVGSTPEGIVVGGRNLLRNTAFKDFKKSEEIYVDNTYTKFANNTLKLICDNTSGTSTKYTVVGSLKSTWNLADVLGQDITISMWIYIETVGQLDKYEFRITFTHNGVMQWFTPNTSYPVNIPSPSDLKVGWNYIYATFRIAEDSTEANFNFTNNARPGKKSVCWISSPKAEFGNKPTAWTPAPEDVDEDINNAQSSADKANSNANNAQNSANNAQDTANKADAKADQAKADSAAASTAAQIAKKQADEAQKKSNTANDIANGAVATISPIAQVVIVDDKGLKILNSENNTSYAQMQSTGLFVFVKGEQRAVFGATSKVENMAIQDYLMFGSHRAETKIEDGEEGTAFFHIGDVK